METLLVLLTFLAKSWWIWIVGLLVTALLVGWLIRRQMMRRRKRVCRAIVVYTPPSTLAILIREYLKYCKALTIWSGPAGATTQTLNWTRPTAQKSAETRKWIKPILVSILCILVVGAAGFGIYNIPFSSLSANIEMPEQNKTLEVVGIVFVSFVVLLLVLCLVAMVASRRKRKKKKDQEETDNGKKPTTGWKEQITDLVEYLEGNPFLVPIYVVLFWGGLTGILRLLKNETTEHWGFSVWDWFVIDHSAAYWVTPLLLTGGGLLYRVKSRVAKTVALLFLFLMASLWVVALSNSFTKTPMGRDMAMRVEKERYVHASGTSSVIIAPVGGWSTQVTAVPNMYLTYMPDRTDQKLEILKNGTQVFVDPPGTDTWVDLGSGGEIVTLNFRSHGPEPMKIEIKYVPRNR